MKAGRVKTLSKIVRFALITSFLVLIGYSLFRIWDTNHNYVMEQRVREQMARFRPDAVISIGDPPNNADGPLAVVNQTIIDARDFNPDVLGWIAMDGTRIDYPFVQVRDNDYYLRRDINQEYSYAGTVFMDYRCAEDFSDFTSVLYGHNMGNGTMFSDIGRYDSADFFAANDTGWLYLSNATYKLEVFAYMTVRADDGVIYSAGNMDDYDRQNFLTYIQESALRYRDLSLTTSDRFVVLSTCTELSGSMRSVIIARLVSVLRQK